MGSIRRIALLALAALWPLAAAAEAVGYQAVPCPQQGFTTRCEAGMTWRWDSAYGLTIRVGEGDGLPCLMIWASDGAIGDCRAYFDDTLTPWMERCLGEDLLSVGDYAVYNLGEGIELPGVMYIFRDPEGRRQTLFRLFDGRGEGNVCYTLRYRDGEEEDALRALGVAASGLERTGGASPWPGTGGEGATLLGDGTIACPAQGFTARCEAARAVRWREGAGLAVYLDGSDRLPCVLVNVAGTNVDPDAFFEQTATPWMRWRYGEDLLEAIDCGALAIGGRVMRGVGYRIRRDGEILYTLRVLENREGASVSYTARFREADPDERRATLDALEALAESLEME